MQTPQQLVEFTKPQYKLPNNGNPPFSQNLSLKLPSLLFFFVGI